MKVRLLQGLLSFSLLSSSLSETQHKLNTVEDALAEGADSSSNAGAAAGATNSEAISDTSTTFNGAKVPPMKVLTGRTFDDEVKHGYWFIKHYSPWCHHCAAIAPTWQTLYEYYYTSKPSSSMKSSNALSSFTRYYDFNFASINCEADGDLCNKHNVNAFPTFQLWKDGELIKKFDGKKDMAGLSEFVEETLESIKPGSRTKDGPSLPTPSATSSPDYDGKTDDEDDDEMLDDRPTKATKKSGAAKTEADAEIATASGRARTSISQKPNRPSKSHGIPNPNGTSISLTQEAFQKLVTNTQDPWFVKFFAPWCPHCQALAPSWEQMAKEMQGKLKIGEVNCDRESRLCKDVRVKAYPTMHFFRGGERVEYDGLRGLGDLINYAKKAIAIGDGVVDVDAESFKEMEETEEVIFLYFYDHATTSEDFEALERLTLSLVGHARLVKTNSAALADRFKISTWPRLLVSRDGRASYYNPLAPRDMRDFRQVLSWMQSVWLPLVPELTASNSRDIMNGKYVVLGVLSRENKDEFILDKREMKSAALDWMEKQTHGFQLERQEMRDAKQLRLEEAEDRGDDRGKRQAKAIRIDIKEEDRKQVGFAWIDGVFWERWLRTTYGVDVRNGHRVIINDEDNRRYWDRTFGDAPIMPSRSSILETLTKVVREPPLLSSKSSAGPIAHIFYSARHAGSTHPWMSLGLVIGVIIGMGYWGKGRIRRSRSGGFFRLDGNGKEMNGNGGMWGKVD